MAKKQKPESAEVEVTDASPNEIYENFLKKRHADLVASGDIEANGVSKPPTPSRRHAVADPGVAEEEAQAHEAGETAEGE